MSTEVKFCAECGARLEDGSQFCGECGVKVAGLKDQQTNEPQTKKTPRPSPSRNKIRANIKPNIKSFNKTDELSPNFQETARFSYRMGAMLIDWSIVGSLSFLSLLIVDEYMYLTDEILFTFLIPPIILFAWFYNAAMEASKLQTTVGKYLFGLKVTDDKGARCTLIRTSIRFVGKLINLFLYGAGYFMVVFTKRKQALHDKLAMTLVLEDEIKVKFMKNLLK